jgi:hypothetical protein
MAIYNLVDVTDGSEQPTASAFMRSYWIQNIKGKLWDSEKFSVKYLMLLRGIFLLPLLKIRRMSVALLKRATRMVCSASNIPMFVSCHCAVNIQPPTCIVWPWEEARLVRIWVPGVVQKSAPKMKQTSLRGRFRRNYCQTHISLVWKLWPYRQQTRTSCPHTKISQSV